MLKGDRGHNTLPPPNAALRGQWGTDRFESSEWSIKFVTYVLALGLFMMVVAHLAVAEARREHYPL